MTRDELARAMSRLPSLDEIRAENERRKPRPFDPADMSDPRARIAKSLDAMRDRMERLAAIRGEPFAQPAPGLREQIEARIRQLLEWSHAT
jgi:hypothetical protein